MTAITIPHVWYATQLASLFFSFLTFISSSIVPYKLAYLFVTASLFISLYQSLTREQPKTTPGTVDSASGSANSESTSKSPSSSGNARVANKKHDVVSSIRLMIKPARSHSTTPYALLALAYLLIFSKSKISLIPFDIFAFFHVINYTSSSIIDLLPVNATMQGQIKKCLEYTNTRYNPIGFRIAVWVQLLTFLISVLWTVLNLPLNLVGYGDGHSLLNIATTVCWVFFIEKVQSQNLLMKAAINNVVAIIDGITADPRVPLQLRDLWTRVKHIAKFKDFNHVQ